MATLQTRPFSGNYSGLSNQAAVAAVVGTFCVTVFELMRRKRRGKGIGRKFENGLGSTETWEFGYLFQGRSWAARPSPPLPKWPLAWVVQAVRFPENQLLEMIGLDATLYCRFLRGCWYFTLLHTLTTLPILLPIHLTHAPADLAAKSMARASVSSITGNQSGRRLLFVNLTLAYWITGTWIFNLLWICRGAFLYRAEDIKRAADRISAENQSGDIVDTSNRGLRLRTVMVSNIPAQLRSEKELRDYFQYHLSRPNLTPPISPGFLPKLMSFVFNRAHRKVVAALADQESISSADNQGHTVTLEKVVLARKMTELASLLERREEVLRSLEHAHIRLARKALLAVKAKMENTRSLISKVASRRSMVIHRASDEEEHAVDAEAEAQMEDVIQALTPFLDQFGLRSPPPAGIPLYARFSRKRRIISRSSSKENVNINSSEPFAPPSGTGHSSKTVWEVLHSLPREHLDAFQPLIRLSALFRGKTVPAIDYYAMKLGLLTALINEKRSKPVEDFTPASTAFVTFQSPDDAVKALKFLPSHPENPMACTLSPAPDTNDLDWTRVMKSSFTGEFLKDWVVNLGVWGFTCFWIFPVSLFVGLVSIDNLSQFIPWLKNYLAWHPRTKELLSSFLPTLLVAGLAILIPLLLLLIGKKAHTILTLSKLHDRIMTRYYKFLILNVVIFFCIGVTALESFLISFRNPVNPLPLIAQTIPTAGPFYVGWLVLQTALHGGFELGLFGLPLLTYPGTKKSPTPRRREFGIRPRTFNYYYWLPNHVVVMIVIIVFAILNPLVIPFGFLYVSVEFAIIKNQLLHVYSHYYEGNGEVNLIRILRYSLDGAILGQVVFLAMLVILKEDEGSRKAISITLLTFTGLLIAVTVAAKLYLTRYCRANFKEANKAEAAVYCGTSEPEPTTDVYPSVPANPLVTDKADVPRLTTRTQRSFHPSSVRFWTWRLPIGMDFAYSTLPARVHRNVRRQPIPFSRPVEGDTKEINETSGKENSPTPESQNDSSRPQLGLNSEARQYLVHPHAPRRPWNDAPRLDVPYDNPNYTRELDNFLWLPRNPCDILDLDDTVDMHRALTSEPGAGELGEWLNETTSSLSFPAPTVESPTSDLSLGRNRSFVSSQRRLDGTEDISLSSVLALRVEELDEESDIDEAQPPPSRLFSRRRSSTLSRRPIVTGRSVSATHRPPGSQLLAVEQGRLRSYSVGQNRPTSGEPATASPFADPANLSVISNPRRRLSHNSGITNTPVVSARDAMVEEVLAEEQQAAAERDRQEQEENNRATGSRSYWTSWMWRKIPFIS